MKKLILAAALLFITSTAQALILDVEYTGVIKERIDLCGYGCGNVGITSYTSNLMFAGGPVANNSMGYAQQFSLDQETRIDYLLASARIQGDWGDSGTIGRNQLNFKLYTNSKTIFHQEPSDPYPDENSMALLAQMELETGIDYFNDPEYGDIPFNTDGVYKDFPLLFGITLAPGNYWIAQERYPGNENLAISWTPADNISVKFFQNDLAVMHSPEISSLIMLVTGLLAMGKRFL